ncbi:MAG TPA: hypothetical protein VFU02_15815 [Polyangiaceae bacterium]|nr:hypothetical protein [Polyangiaceae bacterium]
MNAPIAQSQTTFCESVAMEATYRFDQVSDAELLTSTQRLVGRSNRLLAALLAHLAEVEARGIHRLRACASLYAYCVFELRLSEDAAFRRARAARVARRFPVILQQVADGELHLTALVMLAPHLTEENHRELLARAKHRTKREILSLVRAFAPEPTLPDRVEPLGPQPVGIPMPGAATWRTFVESLASSVRELPPGQRPKDWTDGANVAGSALARPDEAPATGAGEASGRQKGEAATTGERFRVQFTASQEYVDLLERAQDLLSHAVPDRSLEAVHLRALRLLVDELEKRKYGAPRRKPPAGSKAPVGSNAPAGSKAPAGSNAPASSEPVVGSKAPASSGLVVGSNAPTSRELDRELDPAVEPSSETLRRARQSKKHAHAPRQRGSATVRREVRDRDGLQCTFVDETSRRCTESRFLELHHVLAHARGGRETATNLTMYCRAHNTLAAEQDFGRSFMQERRSGA